MKSLKECCCCGGYAGKYEQWHNRDTDYGICRGCLDYEIARGASAEMIKQCYGIEGEHYAKKQENIMSKFEELLAELNSVNIPQQSMMWEEDIPENLWYAHFSSNKSKVLIDNLNIDAHRWYEISTTVVAVGGGLLGIRHISKTYTEMDVSDIGWTRQFFEMEEIRIISYKPKVKQ